jgi:hypothetical protein
MDIKYSERVFVALVIQYAKHMRCTLLLSVAFRSYSIFPQYFINETIFGKSVIRNKICVLIFYPNFGWSISHFKKNSVRYYHKFTHSFMKSASYSCQILLKHEFSR